MTWKNDPTYMEPKPRRYDRIHCFNCRRDLANKAAAVKHRGHDVMYLDKDGKVME